MAQFFAHILPRKKSEIGKISSSETHERTTCLQIIGTDLHDLLVHFACERTGLEKKDIEYIALERDVYAKNSLDQSLIVRFNQKLVPEHQKQERRTA